MRALLGDDAIEAITSRSQIPAMHAEWTIAALHAGKPVLCEAHVCAPNRGDSVVLSMSPRRPGRHLHLRLSSSPFATNDQARPDG